MTVPVSGGTPIHIHMLFMLTEIVAEIVTCNHDCRLQRSQKRGFTVKFVTSWPNKKYACKSYVLHLKVKYTLLFISSVRSSLDRAVQVRALAGDIVLCSWARHFTLTVPLSTQEYKWVLANCWGNLTNCWGVTCDGLASRPGGVEILLAASCYKNWDKLQQL